MGQFFSLKVMNLSLYWDEFMYIYEISKYLKYLHIFDLYFDYFLPEWYALTVSEISQFFLAVILG